jgi:DNA-binding transcriptional ArsR family regulator
MKEFMAIAKVLSDPGRVRILLSLRQGELCVCQITELFGLATSTVSKHLSLLHQAGLVSSRKDNKWVYYRLPDRERSPLVRDVLKLAIRSLENCDEAVKDAAKLGKVLKMDAREICRRQCR